MQGPGLSWGLSRPFPPPLCVPCLDESGGWSSSSGPTFTPWDEHPAPQMLLRQGGRASPMAAHLTLHLLPVLKPGDGETHSDIFLMPGQTDTLGDAHTPFLRGAG